MQKKEKNEKNQKISQKYQIMETKNALSLLIYAMAWFKTSVSVTVATKFVTTWPTHARSLLLCMRLGRVQVTRLILILIQPGQFDLESAGF